MDDPNIIATLIACKEAPNAGPAFSLPHNHKRYLPPLPSDCSSSSRETTPFPGEEDSNVKENLQPRLQLSFDKPPKNLSDGHVFGSDPHCDIRLVDRNDKSADGARQLQYVSRRHFSIAFDAQGRLTLCDFSTAGTIVSYEEQAGTQASTETRSHFKWIIFGEFERIRVEIPRTGIKFFIELSRPVSHYSRYRANLHALQQERKAFEESRLAFPLHTLDIRSQSTTRAPSAAFTPRQAPIYLLREELGRGGFGAVYKVVDVSTGSICAGKAFYQPGWENEVSIMKKVTHQHTVRFVDFRPNPTPLLIMEYLPFGNLEDQHQVAPITVEETLGFSVQALQAVMYLHSMGLVHRDIKPANILVSDRSPMTIKLADFGLAKDSRDGLSFLKTWVGSSLYAAPEIWEASPYTSAVDIWSLGVVMLEFAYGLPNFEAKEFKPQTWQRKVIKAVCGRDLDAVTDLLSGSMLRLDPGQRSSASECLEMAHRASNAHRTMLGLGSFETGSETPTESSAAFWEIRPGSEPVNQVWGSEEDRPEINSSTIRLSGESAGRLFYTAQRTASEKDGSKRQRSPDSNPGEVCSTSSSRRTAFRVTHANVGTKSFSSNCALSERSVGPSGQYSTMYETVSELLKDMQIEDCGNEDPNFRTDGLIKTLCQHVKRLKITEFNKYNEDAREQTVITAVSEAREFVLASLPSSHLTRSVADLAAHLVSIMQQLSLDEPTTLCKRRISSTSSRTNGPAATSRYMRESRSQIRSAKALSFKKPVIGPEFLRSAKTTLSPTGDHFARQQHNVKQMVNEISWPTNAADSFSTNASGYPYGLTFPSALLDDINVSGCSPSVTRQ